MTDTRETIEELDRLTRDANMQAIRSNGFRKRVNLWFAAFFAMLGDWGREIERDEQRGDDDSYHDEY